MFVGHFVSHMSLCLEHLNPAPFWLCVPLVVPLVPCSFGVAMCPWVVVVLSLDNSMVLQGMMERIVVHEPLV